MTTASLVPAGTGWRLNLSPLAGAPGHEHSEPLATGVRRLRAGVVDADVAAKWNNPAIEALPHFNR